MALAQETRSLREKRALAWNYYELGIFYYIQENDCDRAKALFRRLQELGKNSEDAMLIKAYKYSKLLPIVLPICITGLVTIPLLTLGSICWLMVRTLKNH